MNVTLNQSLASPALARATERAAAFADRSLAATLVRAAARLGDGNPPNSVATVARAIGLLESALHAHVALVDSGAVRALERSSDQPVRDGIAGAWLLGHASETIASFGDDVAELWADAAHALVRAEILEFEDLYDAGRSPGRYLSVSEMRTGSLLSVAARLGGLLAEIDQPTPDALDECGRQLGIATEIRADVAALSGANVAGSGRPGIGSGRYTLPVLYAIESDPELSGALGKPLDGEQVERLVHRVHSVDSVERSEREAATRVRAAVAAAGGHGQIADEAARLR